MTVATRIPPTAPATIPTKAAAQRSAVEVMKENSRQLRGTIAEELAKDTDHFSEADKNLIKFHGFYQQEDRDARKNRKKDGVAKHYLFMVRCRIPGGKLTAAQYLAVDHLAGQYANGTLRFTSRQGIQLHGVLKSDLKATIAGINDCLLTTLGACGDVERNIMACPAPHHHDGVHTQLQETADLLAAHLAPRTRAYHEIWLNGQPVAGDRIHAVGATGPHECGHYQREEPLYGKTYLPRKFKTGLALPEDNCIDVYAQDLGLLAIVEGGRIVGCNVLVGGGMGMTHGNANTFPHLAKPICYVPAHAVVGVAEAVIKLFRDHGNRADRKRARIKYLVHDWGVEKFRQVLSEYVGGVLHEPKPVQVSGFDLHLGWHPQGDGKWYYGLSVENGRVKDDGSFRLRSGLRAIIERFQPDLRLTPMQDILLCGLDGSAKAEIERLLAEYGIVRPNRLSNVQKHSMACPAIPTCGLAISESERALPGIIDQLETELKRLGLEKETISVRMTGCPNGCARPYQSDIGIVGRSGDKYTLFVGGHVLGHRLNFQLKDMLPRSEIVPTLVPLLVNFKRERQQGETFGDYCQRLGAEKLQALLAAAPKENGHVKANGHTPELVRVPVNGSNGNGHHAVTLTSGLAQPEVQSIPVAPRLIPTLGVLKRSETFLAGTAGEEQRDFTFRYNTDGSVRETVVYFYGDDRRAAQASGQPLRREAVYRGRVDPQRLHAARKLSDTWYVGSADHERRDRRVEYAADGGVAQTVVFFYEGEAQAEDAPSGAALRRQVMHEGELN